jgi:hypothetical protein
MLRRENSSSPAVAALAARSKTIAKRDKHVIFFVLTPFWGTFPQE